jgi:hypothetical protein
MLAGIGDIEGSILDIPRGLGRESSRRSIGELAAGQAKSGRARVALRVDACRLGELLKMLAASGVPDAEDHPRRRRCGGDHTPFSRLSQAERALTFHDFRVQFGLTHVSNSQATSVGRAGSARSATLGAYRTARRRNVMLTRAVRCSALNVRALRVAGRRGIEQAQAGARP